MYNLFVSHSWKHNDEYDRLIDLLKDYSYFDFKNYSVPSSNPLDIRSKKYEEKLKEAIKTQMRTCHAVLVIAGKYVTYSDSIQMELDVSKELGKPVIAIEPWGSATTSQVAKEAADIIVGWNSKSIVSAIRKYAI